MDGTFRGGESADFSDLFNSSSSAPYGANSTYSAFGGPQDEDELAANPFADLASSSAQLPFVPEQRAQSPFYSPPIAPSLDQTAFSESAYVPTGEPVFTPTGDVPASPGDPAASAYQSQASTLDSNGSTYEPTLAEFSAGPAVAGLAAFEPSTPDAYSNTFVDRRFTREAAPEPETPAQPLPKPGDVDGFSYTYSRPSPTAARFRSPSSPTSNAPPEADTPFASQSTRRGKADLSTLLDDEKPAAMSAFRKAERADGSAGSLRKGNAVLSAKSAGKKPVARPLAALLGLEPEEEEPKNQSASTHEAGKASTTDGKPEPVDAEAGAVKQSAPAPTSDAPSAVATEEVEPAPLPPVKLVTEDTATSALETPLPPSRAPTPPRSVPETPTPGGKDVDKPSLSRAVSTATSAVSVRSEPDLPYEAIVSPPIIDATPSADGTAPEADAWPSNKPGEELDDRLATLRVDDGTTPPAQEEVPAPASYSQYIFGEGTANPTESGSMSGPPSYTGAAPSRGFRAFNGSSEDGGFGATDDADSLRGTYSRSVDVGDGDEADPETGASTPATQRTVGVGEQQRAEREGSAPLPPLPTQSPTIQGSPRSTQLGGSLGPTFVITVGDPQTVGSALNPAAQHTVYTVHTRTTSSAYRKSDFAVLRRFSHFLWLYDALTQNNPGVIVPGMPEKHAIGRFGSEFVENRRLGLEAALNKIVSHPMLVGDPDLRLFLESDTFHLDIKQRKIDTTAENKGFLANLSSSIAGPKFTEFDDYFDQRRQQLDAFEAQLRSLIDSLAKAAKARHSLNGSIAELQSAFLALAQCDLSSSLRKLLDEAAAVQKKLHDLSEAQAAEEEKIDGLTMVVESYARLCASAKDVFGARIKAYHTWQAADANLRKMQSAHEKAKRSGRTHSELLNLAVAEITDAERKMLDARHDFDDVSKLTKAEMARLDKEKVDDFKRALEDFADSHAARQRVVVETWQEYHDLLVAAVEANKVSHEARATATSTDASVLPASS